MLRFGIVIIMSMVLSRGVAMSQSELCSEPVSTITLVLPYEDAASRTAIWANEEEEIDFRRDFDRAGRCTAAFTATELTHFLQQTLNQATISFAQSRPENGFFIELAITDPASRKDSFTLEPVDNGIVITGQGRTGLLYGGYEFLWMQGWRWYAPGKEGQIAPVKRHTLILPKKKTVYESSLNLGRGFYLEYISEESTDFCLWMARNRLNVMGYRPATGALANKLGIIFNNGGHIFEKILNPDRRMSSGRILWDEHRDWYGLPESGARVKDSALETQFCVSQPDLMAFLGEELLELVMGTWSQADLVEIWGFDTWGSTCTCEKCKQLGNGTDQTLHFVSAIRDYLNTARADGRLDHDVTLSTCAYEGTNSMVGPENPFPKNLIDAGDVIVFYPINRCYAHGFYDTSCKENDRYRLALDSWFIHSPSLGVFFGEYYNVSKFEDLPILFTGSMQQDIPGHHNAGCRGLTYMHVPFVNWGLRTLTQVLYAQLAWDATTDVDAFLDDYFKGWYGPFAESMRKVYKMDEDAWRHISQWRSWSGNCVLSQLCKWDGRPSKEKLTFSDHFNGISEVIRNGRHNIGQMEGALKIVDELREVADTQPSYGHRISEDYRSLRYGLQTMALMTSLLSYYDALSNDRSKEADSEWFNIHRIARELDGYWIPIGYADTGEAGIVSKDALTRTQLKDLVQRCKQYRIEGKLPLQP